MRTLLDKWKHLPDCRICVIGDMILDRYLWSKANRISPEAPVLVLEAQSEEDRLGGAAGVASLLRGLGREVTLLGVVGQDASGDTIRNLMSRQGLSDQYLITDRSRMTTTKSRILSAVDKRQAHQIVRLDREHRHPVAEGLEETLVQAMRDIFSRVDCVLISDYGKGTCSKRILSQAIGLAAQYQLPILVDPAKGVSFDAYRHATVITPNRVEAMSQWPSGEVTLENAATVCHDLRRAFGIDSVVLKLDRDGLVVGDQHSTREFRHPQPLDVCDVTGAGDTVLALLGCCLGAGWSLGEAAAIANVAAGIQVERVGVEIISHGDIAGRLHSVKWTTNKLVSVDELSTMSSQHHAQGQRIVFTNGCFDLLHPGHVSCLEEAAAQGDILIVAVNSDESIRQLKGPQRPIQNQHDRLRMVAALACVDYVVLMTDLTPHWLLEQLRPDVLVKGAPYDQNSVVGAEVVRSYGGIVHISQAVDGISTTTLVNRLSTGSPH